MSDAVRRCAIYTRKSSDDGLDQDFNSLQAQREACEAFISSQSSLGWDLLPFDYSDGGYSGGSLERPALKALLEDVGQRRVDIIVVHKIDRLTRSIRDFGRIAERIEAHGASIASVTQHFNTTTSLGRLTLNMLLSFAQFERELTSERIREKLRASRERGMWMGGVVPFGYVANGRMLSEHPTEGALLRDLFDRYLKFGNLSRLQKSLDTDLRFQASRLGKPGKKTSTGALGHLLANRVYVGEICSKGVCVPGRHDALIGAAAFDEVQRLLEERSVRFQQRQLRSPRFEFAGLVRNEVGQTAHTSTGGNRRGQKYRYYVFRPRGDAKAQRISASGLERCVRNGLDAFALWHDQNCPGPIRIRQREAINEIVIRRDHIRVDLCKNLASALASAFHLGPGSERSFQLEDGHRLVLSGSSSVLKLNLPRQGFPRLKLKESSKQVAKRQPIETWSETARAHVLLNQLLSGEVDFGSLCAAEHLSDGELMLALQPAFLPPAELSAHLMP